MKLRVVIAWFAALCLPLGAARVRMEGLRTISEADALALIGARLEHIERDTASASRADDAAFLVRQLLRTHGFDQVQVDWRIASANEIVLRVVEGRRLILNDVRISGVPDKDAKRLEKLFRAPAMEFRIGLESRPPFREDDVEPGLESIRRELNARGYWQAEVKLAKRATDARGGVTLDIAVHTGPVHQIGAPLLKFEPAAPALLERTLAVIAPFQGKPATTAQINQLRLAVEEELRKAGYAQAEVRMGWHVQGGRFIPEIQVRIGKQYVVRDFVLSGLKRTRPGRIYQRFQGMRGKWFDPSLMNKRVRQLLATGAFSSLRTNTIEHADGSVDVTLHFIESRAKDVSFAAGFATDEGPLFGLTYNDRNFAGELLNLSTGFSFTSRGILGDVRLTDPWLFGTDTRGTIRAFALTRSQEGYDKFETGGSLEWVIEFSPSLKVNVAGGWSIVNLSEDGLLNAELGEGTYQHSYLRGSLLWDHRDKPAVPSQGWHLEVPVEIGSAIGNVSTAYFKSEVIGGWYFPLDEDQQLALGGRAGVLVPSGGLKDLPVDLRFFSGGPRSVRSFPERYLGPRSAQNYPLGGEMYWTTSGEYIRRIMGPLKAVAFVDAGTLERNFNGFDFGSPELAVGLGLRLDLPVGPVRLEYGHNLTKDANEPSGTFHFALGIAF